MSLPATVPWERPIWAGRCAFLRGDHCVCLLCLVDLEISLCLHGHLYYDNKYHSFVDLPSLLPCGILEKSAIRFLLSCLKKHWSFGASVVHTHVYFTPELTHSRSVVHEYENCVCRSRKEGTGEGGKMGEMKGENCGKDGPPKSALERIRHF